MYVWKNLLKKYAVSGVKSTGKQHLFFNSWIVNEDGEVLKPPVQLTKLGIYRVRDLKFKRGTRGCNQQVFQQIKIIQCRIPASLDGNTVESDLIQIKTKDIGM